MMGICVSYSQAAKLRFSTVCLAKLQNFMGHWFGLFCPRGPAGYLLSLIPAVLLRSLVGAVAKGNRVACRLDSRSRRRKILFFGWLSFGFFRKTAPHFGVSVATGWGDVFNHNVWFERRRKGKEEAYVHLSWQDFTPPLVVIVLRLLFCFFFFYVFWPSGGYEPD